MSEGDKKYVYKWKRKDGGLLTVKEYRELYHSAQVRGEELSSYLESQDVVENLSYGELQSPQNNSAKLVSWFKMVDGEIRMLAYWKYLDYQKEAKELGVGTSEYLYSMGFRPFREYREEGHEEDDGPTRWIDAVTGEILFRKDYMRMFRKAKGNSTSMGDYLKALGFVNILDSKREVYKG